MNFFKQIVLVTMLFITVIGIGGWHLRAHGLVAATRAEARVGRPLTYFSVAGVARRTVRRCAVGIYYCDYTTLDLFSTSNGGAARAAKK